MKDFYDIWFMANTWTFEWVPLRNAILSSFKRRGVAIPRSVPFALTQEFLNDPQKKQQWSAFIRRLYPGIKAPSLEEVGALVRDFLLPCILSAAPSGSDIGHWAPSVRWTEDKPK